MCILRWYFIYSDIKTHGSEWQRQENKKQAHKNKKYNHYCESITQVNLFFLYGITITSKIFHNTATFEFALLAYNLPAIISQHTIALKQTVKQIVFPSFVATVSISPKQIVNIFTIGEF